MQCQICKNNEATIHLTEINDGVRSELHMCEYCAAEKQIAVKNQIPLNELLSSLLAAAPDDEQITLKAQAKVQCPACGFALVHLKDKSVLGCPLDYEVFEKSLMPLIENAHGGKTVHCGKVPSKLPKDTKNQVELLNLKARLEGALKTEDYEQAAKIRDQIAEIEPPDENEK